MQSTIELTVSTAVEAVAILVLPGRRFDWGDAGEAGECGLIATAARM